MKKIVRKNSSILSIVMISAAAICAALVIMMSYLNAPIADDIGFVLTAQKLSLFDFLHNSYGANWTVGYDLCFR